MMLILELCFASSAATVCDWRRLRPSVPLQYFQETGWYTFNDISNMIAVSESTRDDGSQYGDLRRLHIKGFSADCSATLTGASVGHHHCDYLEDSR